MKDKCIEESKHGTGNSLFYEGRAPRSETDEPAGKKAGQKPAVRAGRLC
jgi:hypothetical protein